MIIIIITTIIVVIVVMVVIGRYEETGTYSILYDSWRSMARKQSSNN